MTDQDKAEISVAVELAAEILRLRTEAGLSQRILAGRIGYSRQYIQVAERTDGVLPAPSLLRAIDDGLSANGALIALRARAADEQRARRQSGGRQPVDQTPAPPQTTGIGLTPLEEGQSDDVNRKTFLRTALGAGAGVLVAGHFPGHDLSDLASAVAGPTAHYRRMEAAVSTTELRPAVEAHLRLVSEVVTDSLPTSVGFKVLSETAGLAAWLAADQGDEGAARRHYVEALRQAERAHHPLLVAYMRASLGHFAVESGDPRPGLALLERAQHEIEGHDVPNAARAWLASLKSVAHAVMGDRVSATAELRNAETLSGNHRGDPQWPWVFAFDAGKAARYQAATLSRLGDLAGARTAFSAASVTLTSPKPRAVAQVDHARVLAQAGQVDEATVLALDALGVGRRYGSVRVIQRIRALRNLLPSMTQETSELDDQLTALYTEGR